MQVSLRRLATAAATTIVAIVLAICVPVSQLHTVATQQQCCCPDPDQCKCPDHDKDVPQTAMGTCHKTQRSFVAPVLPAFIEPVNVECEAPTVVALVAAPELPAPHPAPPPRRPDAPS